MSICEHCGAEFTQKPYRNHKTCSKSCKIELAWTKRRANALPPPPKCDFLDRHGAIVCQPDSDQLTWRQRQALAELPAHMRDRIR